MNTIFFNLQFTVLIVDQPGFTLCMLRFLVFDSFCLTVLLPHSVKYIFNGKGSLFKCFLEVDIEVGWKRAKGKNTLKGDTGCL